MALTGAFLVLFVTFHALMNGVAIFWPSAYNVVCEFLGANWYALVGTLVLAAGFIVHIIYAVWLTVQNRTARGNERYDVTTRPKSVEWSSKNMLVLGIVIVAFLVLHMIQFWAKMQLAEIIGTLHEEGGQAVPAAAGTWFLEIAFSNPWTLPVYLIGFVALWFHLTHGFWSMMQSVGLNNDVWMKRMKCIGNAWVTIVVGLFVIEAVVFTVNAKQGNYTSCPVLQEQYAEMAASHDGEALPMVMGEGHEGHGHCGEAAKCEGHEGHEGHECGEGHEGHGHCAEGKQCEGQQKPCCNAEKANETTNE